MKFEFVKDEVEEPVKISKKTKQKSEIAKANNELSDSWNKFKGDWTYLYGVKVRSLTDYLLFKEIIIVMDGFSLFGMSYDNFDSLMKSQVTRSGWMIASVRKCSMLQEQAKILKREIEKRGYNNILDSVFISSSNIKDDVERKINYLHVGIKHFNGILLKLPKQNLITCEECIESLKEIKGILNNLDIYVSLLLYKRKE